MTDERPSAWRSLWCVTAALVTFLAVFAYALRDMFGGIHAGDPLAPVTAIFAVVAALAIALFAAASVAMLFGH